MNNILCSLSSIYCVECYYVLLSESMVLQIWIYFSISTINLLGPGNTISFFKMDISRERKCDGTIWFWDESFQNMFTNRPKTVGKTVANGEKNRSMTFPTFSNVNWLHISCADYIYEYMHNCICMIIVIVFLWLSQVYLYKVYLTFHHILKC